MYLHEEMKMVREHIYNSEILYSVVNPLYHKLMCNSVLSIISAALNKLHWKCNVIKPAVTFWLQSDFCYWRVNSCIKSFSVHNDKKWQN
jgi:hypothetical protein